MVFVFLCKFANSMPKANVGLRPFLVFFSLHHFIMCKRYLLMLALLIELTLVGLIDRGLPFVGLIERSLPFVGLIAGAYPSLVFGWNVNLLRGPQHSSVSHSSVLRTAGPKSTRTLEPLYLWREEGGRGGREGERERREGERDREKGGMRDEGEGEVIGFHTKIRPNFTKTLSHQNR